ncbi:MAG: histidine kinase, partial [Bacteroidota bacterium]
MFQLRQLSPYWLCQFVGWGAVIPYWFYYESRGDIAVYWVFVSVFSQAGLQIFVTDQYRRLVHRRRWLERPLGQLLPVVLVAWLCLVFQYMLMAYTVFRLRYDFSYFQNDTALGALAGGSRYHAIWLLAFHLYHYARQSANQRAVLAEAQLAKLTNELNPHFLFNALTGIKGLTREDPTRARSAIDRLAELLRYSLRRSTQPLVPLAEELAIIDEYVALEQMRLEERLTFVSELPDGYEACHLPPLSLHTLVENAVKHGIALLPAGGTIRLQLEKR